MPIKDPPSSVKKAFQKQAALRAMVLGQQPPVKPEMNKIQTRGTGA